jgi:hypothetical protein
LIVAKTFIWLDDRSSSDQQRMRLFVRARQFVRI